MVDVYVTADCVTSQPTHQGLSAREEVALTILVVSVSSRANLLSYFLRLHLANQLDCRQRFSLSLALRCYMCFVCVDSTQTMRSCLFNAVCWFVHVLPFQRLRSYGLAVLRCKARSFLHIMWRACVSVCKRFSASKTSKKKEKKKMVVYTV